MSFVSQHQVRHRQSDSESAYFRCDRYFSVGHEWYATTREAGDIGPFISRDQAELELAYELVKRSAISSEQIESSISNAKRAATVFEILVLEFSICFRESTHRTGNRFFAWIKQELDELAENAAGATDAAIRERALQHLLAKMDH